MNASVRTEIRQNLGKDAQKTVAHRHAVEKKPLSRTKPSTNAINVMPVDLEANLSFDN